MTFGDWELFRIVIVSLREMELSSFTYEEGPRSVRFTVGSEQISRKGVLDIHFSSCFLFGDQSIIQSYYRSRFA